jgi:hypothetical protein
MNEKSVLIELLLSYIEQEITVKQLRDALEKLNSPPPKERWIQLGGSSRLG